MLLAQGPILSRFPSLVSVRGGAYAAVSGLSVGWERRIYGAATTMGDLLQL
jgi:hypothetical protein